jgi:DHA1 family tetracycline resistance protein-like MFS transporter
MILRSNRRYLILFAIVFVNFLGGTIVLPALPLYANRHFGAQPQEISLLLASYFIAQFLAAPLLGRASDRFGRLPVLLYSQIGTVLSFVLMAAAQDIRVLFLARILDGVTGGNVIVAQAYVTDITPKEKLTQGLGIIFAGFGLGYILGPALGGLISAFFSDRAPFVVGAVITVITVLLTAFALDESLPKALREQRRREARAGMRWGDVLANRALQIILLIGFAAQFSIALLQSSIVLFAAQELFRGQPERTVNIGVGLLLTAIGIGQFFTQMVLVRPAVQRFGERRLVFYGAFLRGAGMLSIALFLSPWLVGGVSLTLIAIASGLMMPSLQALATTSARKEIVGAVLGTYNAATSLGIITGTALGGALFDVQSRLPFIVAGLVLLATTIPAWFLMRRGPSRIEAAPAVVPAAVE